MANSHSTSNPTRIARAILLAMLAAVTVTGTVQAQVADTNVRDTLVLMQHQVDLLQMRANMYGGERFMRAVIDQAGIADWSGQDYVPVVGWAFRCGSDAELSQLFIPATLTVDVTIDTLPVSGIYRANWPRPDVALAYASFCGTRGMPGWAGVVIYVPTATVAPGVHFVQLRLTDRQGFTVLSNAVAVRR